MLEEKLFHADLLIVNLCLVWWLKTEDCRETFQIKNSKYFFNIVAEFLICLIIRLDFLLKTFTKFNIS